MVSISKFLSNLFSPVVVAPAAFAILIHETGFPDSNRWILWLIAFVFTALVPVAALIILKKRGMITDLDVSHREQRLPSLVIGLLSYAAAYLFFDWLDAASLPKGLVFCSLINLLVIIAITRYWKISIHAMGLTSPLAALWVMWNSHILPMAALTALVGTSRVVLKAHTPSQVIVGSVLGFSLTFVQLKLFFL